MKRAQLTTYTNICPIQRLLDIMNGSFWASSKYAYPRCSGSGFSSKEDGWMVEGRGRLLAGGREIKESEPVLATKLEWITEELSTQMLHIAVESSQAQLKEPISKSEKLEKS